MNSKIDNGLDKNGKPVSLKSVLEKDINRLNSVSGEDYFDIDKSIHKIRKSLKSISAILLLFEVQFDRIEYLNRKSLIKSLSKQFGAVREPYVLLQTLSKIEEKLKCFNGSNLYELRYNLDLQYNSLVNDLIKRFGAIQDEKGAIIKLAGELNKLDVDFKHKLLRERLLISFQKSRRLFLKLNLSSSSHEYHKFRKWCKIFYHQMIVLNRIRQQKMSKKRKKLFKLTEYLGNEHDLQLLYQYLSTHYPELSKLSEAIFMFKIKRLRKKALALYPKISY